MATTSGESKAMKPTAREIHVVDTQENASTSTQQEEVPSSESIEEPGSSESEALSHTDHGWAWMVLAGSCINFFVLGLTETCFSVLFIEFSTVLRSEKSTIALIGSLQTGITWMSGPVFTRLAEEYSYRVIVMTGGMLAAGGMGLSYGAENIHVLIGAYGLLTGFGRGMIFTPSVVIGALHFEKKRSLATGLIYTAIAVGGITGPLLCVKLLEIYTWEGLMIILGGMYLQTVAAGALFRGIPNAEKEAVRRLRKRSGSLRMPLIDIAKFGIHCLSNFLQGFIVLIVLTFCVLYGTTQGMSLRRAAQMMTLLQVSNASGRFIVAVVGDRRWFPRHLVFGITLLVTSIISLVFLRADESWLFAICCMLYGCSYGIKVSMMSTVLADLFGVQNLPMIQAIYVLFAGMGALSGPAVAGFLLDYTGDMRAIFILCGITGIVAAALQGGALYIDYRQKHVRQIPLQQSRIDLVDIGG